MKKVLYKKWKPTEYTNWENNVRRVVDGTGCFDKDFVNTGYFMQWGNACSELETGFGNYTVALVMNGDGTITEVLPVNIKFIENVPNY